MKDIILVCENEIVIHYARMKLLGTLYNLIVDK